MENALKTVDILYKIFQILNIKYPLTCEDLAVYTNIYGRTTKWDKIDKSVMNLIDHNWKEFKKI